MYEIDYHDQWTPDNDEIREAQVCYYEKRADIEDQVLFSEQLSYSESKPPSLYVPYQIEADGFDLTVGFSTSLYGKNFVTTDDAWTAILTLDSKGMHTLQCEYLQGDFTKKFELRNSEITLFRNNGGRNMLTAREVPGIRHQYDKEKLHNTILEKQAIFSVAVGIPGYNEHTIPPREVVENLLSEKLRPVLEQTQGFKP